MIKQAADTLESLSAERDGLREQLAAALSENTKLAEQVPHWISVKDKLPESHKNSLVIYERKDGLQRFGVGFMDSSKNWYIANGKKSNVLYWMPFPQPPKEDSHEIS